jgi:hypothetical protein
MVAGKDASSATYNWYKLGPVGISVLSTLKDFFPEHFIV